MLIITKFWSTIFETFFGYDRNLIYLMVGINLDLPEKNTVKAAAAKVDSHSRITSSKLCNDKFKSHSANKNNAVSFLIPLAKQTESAICNEETLCDTCNNYVNRAKFNSKRDIVIQQNNSKAGDVPKVEGKWNVEFLVHHANNKKLNMDPSPTGRRSDLIAWGKRSLTLLTGFHISPANIQKPKESNHPWKVNDQIIAESEIISMSTSIGANESSNNTIHQTSVVNRNVIPRFGMQFAIERIETTFL
ncbi:hypothetical protein BDA99DRAFT_568832 [Phascolomyces articulosus]|uniref:Uncharacterized protein n=1 Tax=Phascolomyces articulosus TaxID=60185 RepID=A0AAD5K8P7_9FUNG|nr:hypothetical protein BDA99DRAFT_568832 [Phascolomyces articulosus]